MKPPIARQPNSSARTLPMTASAWPTVRLSPGREKLSRAFHPWIFSGAILDAQPGNEALSASYTGAPPLPGLAKVHDSLGGFIAWGQYNPTAKISLRLMEWQETAMPDKTWLNNKLHGAISRRLAPNAGTATATTACRLVFSEADHLPGLIIERLGAYLVVQSENRITDLWLPLLTELLPSLGQAFIPELAGILERSDGDGRAMEGLAPRIQTLWGSIPTTAVLVQENGLNFWVDLQGQKAGFYTDQRENRALVARYAAGRRVLDVCCYSGGFSLAARSTGAVSLCLVDASADALELARRNLIQDNPMAESCPTEFIQGDAFQVLRQLQNRTGPTGAASFDLIILDPPKLAPSRNSLERALHGYKDLNLQALKLLAPGGILASFSCSGLVSADDLRQAIAFAAKDLGRQVQILHQLGQAPCHPILLSFPEGQYLKGFLLRVI